MIVETTSGLVFDSSDSRCIKYLIPMNGLGRDKAIAFIRCYDKKTGRIKEYCGLYDDNNVEQSIEDIMYLGSKFDRMIEIFTE